MTRVLGWLVGCCGYTPWQHLTPYQDIVLTCHSAYSWRLNGAWAGRGIIRNFLSRKLNRDPLGPDVVAELVERRPPGREIGGSIPGRVKPVGFKIDTF